MSAVYSDKKHNGHYLRCYFQDYDKFNENYNSNPNVYIPKIKNRELELGIAFLDFDYLPILTSRIYSDKRKYYLFDFIKIWQTNAKREFI